MIVEKQVPLQPHNTFGIVARALHLARIRSEADIAALRAWRAEIAKEHNLPAYVVFHDTTLAEMARQMVYAQHGEQAYTLGLKVYTTLRAADQQAVAAGMPQHLRGRLLAEITRMTVISGYPQPVKLALVKAIHLYCVALQIGGIPQHAEVGRIHVAEALSYRRQAPRA